MEILYPRKVSQWWYQSDNNTWALYDDLEINIKLDKEYILYQKDQIKRQINTNFPITKHPGTH